MKKINRRNDMASKLARVKETILELLSDEKEYTTDDMRVGGDIKVTETI